MLNNVVAQGDPRTVNRFVFDVNVTALTIVSFSMREWTVKDLLEKVSVHSVLAASSNIEMLSCHGGLQTQEWDPHIWVVVTCGTTSPPADMTNESGTCRNEWLLLTKAI